MSYENIDFYHDLRGKLWMYISFGILFCFVFLFWTFCGIFVIQPIKILPDGVTIVYWRYGLNLPFVSSADGILAEKSGSVNLLGRAMVLGVLAEPLRKRIILRLPYSEWLYLVSTSGKLYEK